MVDVSGVKYFDVIFNNKWQEYKLKEVEEKIDYFKWWMFVKFWKEKYDLMDDLVLFYVKILVFVVLSKVSFLYFLFFSRIWIEI